MGKITTKRLIESKSMLKAEKFHKEFYMDFFILKVLEMKGRVMQRDIDGYYVYGVPKDKPSKVFIVEQCAKKKRIVGRLTGREVIKAIKEMLPKQEFYNWLEYNLGILDVLEPMFNDDFKMETNILKNFLRNPNKGKLSDIIKSESNEDINQILITEKVILCKQKQIEKAINEKAINEAEIKYLNHKVEHYEKLLTLKKRKGITENPTQKTLSEVLEND